MEKPQEKPSLGKVLVIGGNGFLGYHVIKQLLTEWTATVYSLDLRCDRNRVDGATYITADITDAKRLEVVLGEVRPDVVVHTASPEPQGESLVAHQLFYKVNVEGTRCVVAACQKTRVRALVYTSSASVLSDNVSDLLNADEEFPVYRGKLQTAYYSETKAQAEEDVLKANRENDLLTCAIRPSGIFGEADSAIVKNFMAVYREGRHTFQIGNNNNIFDFTYVGNVAYAHLLAAQRLLATAASSIVPLDIERVDGEAFLVTNDEPIYFWDFSRAVWRAAGCESGLDAVRVIPRGLGLMLGRLSEAVCALAGKRATFNRQRILYASMTRYFNISKARSRLGYKPQVGLEEAIRRSVAWAIEHGQ